MCKNTNKSIALLLAIFCIFLVATENNLLLVKGDSEFNVLPLEAEYEMFVGITENQTMTIERSGDAFMIFMLIPPNAIVTKAIQLQGLNSLEDYGEFSFRCYNFAFFLFNTTYVSEDLVEVTLSPNGPLVPYVAYDELADPLINSIKTGEWGLSNPIFLGLENASKWKGYQEYEINRTQPSSLPMESCQYVIIVPQKWSETIEPLVQCKIDKGLGVYVATTEQINLEYNGMDLSEKIREFIQDTFNNWKTRYVLLVGGNDTIPSTTSNIYHPGEGTLVPFETDVFYRSLDGPYNPQSPGIKIRPFPPYPDSACWRFPPYPDSACWWVCPERDCFDDVAVGRLPSYTSEDVTIMINKIVSYETNPEVGDWLQNFLGIVGWISDDISWPVVSHMDYIQNLEKTWLVFGENLTSSQQVTNFLNNGCSVFWFLGHGSEFSLRLSPEIGNLEPSDVESLQNGKKLPIVFSEACYTGRFGASSISTSFLRNPVGGAVAVFGGSWREWGDSTQYIRSIMFGIDEDHYPGDYRLGSSLIQGSFIKSAYYCTPSRTVLIGDPEMSVWTCEPKDLVIEFPNEVEEFGEVRIRVLEASTMNPMPFTTLRLVTNSSWAELRTGIDGKVSYDFDLSEGMYDIDIFALHRNKPTLVQSKLSIIPKVIDTMPPIIESVTQSPPSENVQESEVEINAIVSDDVSEELTVTLNYSVNIGGDWHTISMSYDGEKYSAIIPVFSYGSNVTYVVITEDEAGNIVSTEDLGYEYTYEVIPEYSMWLLPSLLLTAITIVVINKKNVTSSS